MKICVVTGTRADYGLLSPVIRALSEDAAFSLQLVATGMHLSPEFGLTHAEIEEDGFSIDARVEMLLSSDTDVGVAKSIGLGTIGFAEALDRLRPDLLLLLGDRFEILAAAQAALVMKIPVAHLSGGDTTEGAFDEAIRHALTKMSHLHFVTNSDALHRVLQLGEDPRHVYNVGSPAIDRIKSIELLDRASLEASLDFELRPRNLLITFHPVTLDVSDGEAQFRALLDAVEALGDQVGLIFTKPNSDPGGRALIEMIDGFVATRPHAAGFTSLGQLRYYSALKLSDAVVGNSSSGIYEAPSFGKPTVNIGDRQKGRLQAGSVIDCAPDAAAISRAVAQALASDCSGVVSPYGDGTATEQILSQLKRVDDPQALLMKRFFDARRD